MFPRADQDYKFEVRITKLSTQVIAPDSKACNAYAVIANIPIERRDSSLIKSISNLVVIIQEEQIEQFLEELEAKNSHDEKFQAFSNSKLRLGYLRFYLKKRDELNPEHVAAEYVENTSKFKHVGYALDEYNLRYGLKAGVNGRTCLEASWESHGFHRKCGMSPGCYINSQKTRQNKEKRMDLEILQLQKRKAEAKAEMKKEPPLSDDDSDDDIGSISMYRCDEVIQLRMKQLHIGTTEEGLTDSNFLSMEEFRRQRCALTADPEPACAKPVNFFGAGVTPRNMKDSPAPSAGAGASIKYVR